MSEESHIPTDDASAPSKEEPATEWSEAALLELEKMASTGALLAGLGHALNNRMAPVVGYAQLFARRFEDDPKTRKQAAMIEAAAQDIQAILERLMRQVRSDLPQYAPGDLNEVVNLALTLCEPKFRRRGIETTRDLAESLPDVPFNLGLLLQGLLSVFHRVENAFETDVPEKRLSVETRAKEEGVAIRIADNGRGIAPDEIEQWLDSVHPLRQLGRSEVFNLSIADGVARKHKGELTIESPEGQGCAVEIFLPLNPAARKVSRYS